MSSKQIEVPRGYNNQQIIFRNTKEKVDAVGFDLGNGSQIELILFEKLDPFPKNREVDNTDIDIFSENIERNGFQSTITVSRRHGVDEEGRSVEGRYYIVSGHRRKEAFGLILERNPTFMKRKMPALVLRDDIPFDQLEELNLLMNYDARAESPKEMRGRVARLLELLKQRGVEKKLIDQIADKLQVSARQIRKYIDINAKLSVGLLEKLDEGYITINEANDYASRSAEAQEYILKFLNEHNNVMTKEEYQEIKKQDDERQASIKASEEKAKEYERKIALQQEEINDLQKKINDKGKAAEESGAWEYSELEETKEKLEKAREKANKYKAIIDNARTAAEKGSGSSIGITAHIMIAEQISRLAAEATKLKSKTTRQSYILEPNDVEKIRTIINDLNEMITIPKKSEKK